MPRPPATYLKTRSYHITLSPQENEYMLSRAGSDIPKYLKTAIMDRVRDDDAGVVRSPVVIPDVRVSRPDYASMFAQESANTQARQEAREHERERERAERREAFYSVNPDLHPVNREPHSDSRETPGATSKPDVT